MTPTHFDIYVRQGGRWRRLEQVEGGDKDAAVLRAAELDKTGGFDGVRAMEVVEYGSGRPPLETLAWISPHLNKMANVQRQMKNAVRVAAKTDETVEIDIEEPSPDLVQSYVDEPIEQENRPQAAAPTAPPSREPPPAPPDPLRAAARIAGAVAIAFAITAVLFVPVSAGIRALGQNMNLGTQVIQNSILGATLLVFLISAAFLMARVYRDYRDLMDRAEAYAPPASISAASPAQTRRRVYQDELNLPRRPRS